MLKKKAMLAIIPAFWNVPSMPEATPRCCGGTAFMTLVVLGAAKRPIAMPMNSSRAKKTQRLKSPGKKVSRMKAAPVSIMAPVAKRRAP